MGTEPAVGIAAFVVDHDGPRTLDLEAAPPVRGASVLKPLLCWAGATLEPFARDPDGWAALAEPAITRSDNGATAALWASVGGAALLTGLNERVGLSWTIDGVVGEHPSLRVMVTARELARAYATLAANDGDAATQVRAWMRDVRDDQTFGLQRLAAEVLAVDASSVGVKCGWFGGERLHAVVLVEGSDGGPLVGSAVTTSHTRPADSPSRADARDASGDDARLVAVHEALAGEALRAATRRALSAASARRRR